MKNLYEVNLNGATLWYSYDTLVAYRLPNEAIVCSENQWSATTAKHLNSIQPDKSKRIAAESFNWAVKHLTLSFDYSLYQGELT